jgi:hypothetical protein
MDAYGNPVKIAVDIYKKGSTTKKQTAKLPVNSNMLRDVLSHSAVERFKDFPIQVGPYAGAMVSVAVLPNQEEKKKNPLTNTVTHGGLVVIRGKEVYNRNRQGIGDKRSYIPEVRACGFGALDEDLVRRYLIAVDLTSIPSVIPQGDRLWLCDKAANRDALNWKALADHVAQSLSEEVKADLLEKGNEDESDDIALQREMLKMIKEMMYGGGTTASTSTANPGGLNTASSPSANTSPRNLIGSNPHTSRGKMRPLPIRPGNYGSSEPLLRIGRDPILGWCTFYNYDSAYHDYRCSVITRDDKVVKMIKGVDKKVVNITEVVNKGVVWETGLEAMRTYIETAKVEMPKVKLDDVMDLLTPERLQSSFNASAFTSNVAKRLRKKQ